MEVVKETKKQVFIAWTSYIRRPESMQQYFGYKLYFLPLPFPGRLLKPLSYLINGGRTLWILLRERPGTIWVQLAPGLLLYVAYAYKLFDHTVNIVSDCHNSMFKPLWLKLPFTKKLLKRCKIVLVHNDNVKEHVENEHIATGKIVKLETRPAQVQCHVGRKYDVYKRPWVLYPCSFDRDEPVSVVLRAATLIPDVNVIITGDTSRASGIHDLSTLPGNVIMTGFLTRQRFDELLCNADLVMGLTTSNNVQLSVANEAVGAKRPMVISDTKLLRSLFYKGAIYVETRNSESVARGVASALDKHAVLMNEVVELKKEREVRWCAQADYVQTRLHAENKAT